MKSFSSEEVAHHNKESDCWIIVNGNVYDVTNFLMEHPGGKRVLVKVAGKDASKEFTQFHDVQAVLSKYHTRLCIGSVSGGGTQQPKAAAAPLAATPSAHAPVSSNAVSGLMGEHQFGDGIPNGDPSWYQGWHSLFYTEKHRRVRAAVRTFVDTEILPFVHDWDEEKTIPRELYGKCFRAGILPLVVGPPFPKQYVGGHVAGGIAAEDVDAFVELVAIDELSRCASGGVVWGLAIGLAIGLPPVLHFGSQRLKDMCVAPCLRGEKFICLAITEPSAGSDVANLKTEAKLSADGRHYILNGEKKWITNGIFADFFSVAARTGGPGMGGVSMLLVERTMPGVTTRQMKCQGVWCSGTTYITFEDVKVPVENLIGEENKGFKYVMYNFNHERWSIAAQAIRFARVCLEESTKYALKRKTFGQRLIDHPVIRMKIANMSRQIEAAQAWLESITLQLTRMSYEDAVRILGGPIASLKAHASITFEYCAREAMQIFGGIAYTRSNSGAGKVERLYREVRAYAIPAGSEEIMLDLQVRQSLKLANRL